ncbi:MAG: caspase family protein [Saprospiraceae bacterium]
MTIYKSFFAILLYCFSYTMSLAQCIQGQCTNGTGTFVYPSGAKYSGQFVASQIQGLGTLWMNNGNTYSGQWVKNYREGQGKMIFKNGDTYTGSFKRSRLEGKGKMIFAEGGYYEGEWKNDMPNGKGIYSYANGEKYEGLLYAGVRQGFGRYYYTDHSIYDGQWTNNLREGSGTLIHENGEKITAQWYQDQPLSSEGPALANQNTALSSDASTPNSDHNGELKNCNENVCHNETGVYTYRDGSRYVGTFDHGDPRGQGILYYANGDRYEGEWDDVAPQGRGVMYFTSGKVFAAMWEKGKPVKILENRPLIPQRNDIRPQTNDEIKIWTVVVGVARYEHMPALRYSDDDAYRIYAFLKSPEGGALKDDQIKILVDEDATRDKIISALQEQFGRADENDVVILYYSGHGVNNALIPIDFDGFNNKLYHDEITQIMEKSRAKHKLCLIDACYAGGMSEAQAAKADFTVSMNNYYSTFNREQGGTAFILSCRNREVSLEDSGLRQGIFSHYLITGLKGAADKNSNKIVTVQELFNFISSQVQSYTDHVQNPQIEGQYNPNMPVAWIRD